MTLKLTLPPAPLTGGCQCGSVRYALSGIPVVFYICHCTDCQKQSSSAFGQSFRVRSGELSISGTLSTFERPAGNGRAVACDFCAECGTRLFHRRAKYADTVNIKAGTLDDTSWLIPAGHIWVQSKQPWVKLPHDALIYDRQPDDGDAALITRWQEMLTS